MSLLLALAGWLRPGAALLAVIGVAMLAFGVLDLREIVHQIDEHKAGLAVLAGIVAALHLAAGGVAWRLRAA